RFEKADRGDLHEILNRFAATSETPDEILDEGVIHDDELFASLVHPLVVPDLAKEFPRFLAIEGARVFVDHQALSNPRFVRRSAGPTPSRSKTTSSASARRTCHASVCLAPAGGHCPGSESVEATSTRLRSCGVIRRVMVP